MESELNASEDEAGAVAEAPDLGRRAFGGALWIVGQTLGSKVAAVAAQLILAALLSKRDFGEMAEITLIVSLVGLSQQMGVGEILVQRHRNFRHWVNIAFWLNLTFGCIGAAGVAGMGLFTPLFFKDAPDLPLMLVVAAIALPFDAMTVIAQAKLRSDLHFRSVALINMGNVVGTAILSVGFAATRLIWPHSPVGGAMSLVLPRPLMSAAMMAASFRVSRLRIKMRPMVRRWVFVLRDARYFYIMTLFNTLLGNGDYLLVGLFFTTEQLGAYYFAFNLSLQTVQLVAGNFSSVLLPSFAKLDRDRARQTAAYLRVCSMIMLVGVILCVMQGVAGGPLLHMVYKAKWNEAIPLFETLTAGMIFILPNTAVTTLLQAQARYRTSMIWSMVMAAFFLLSVSFGVMSGRTEGVAIADVIFFAIFGVLNVIVPFGFTWQQFSEVIRRVYLFPVLAGGGACAMAVGVFMACGGLPEPVRTVAALVAAVGVYAVAILAFRHEDVKELMERLRPVLNRFRKE
jgi:O-antigen/teichoic acid export membrane protein